MKIQINTDQYIKGHESFTSDVSSQVEAALNRFQDQITRVELHLSDTSGYKFGEDDRQCTIEVRLKGKRPIAVTDHAETLVDAIKKAVGKMINSVETSLDQDRGQHRHRIGSVKHYQNIPSE